MDVFELSLLELWCQLTEFSRKPDALETLYAFFSSDATLKLLKQVTDYLRKELKVPQYEFLFDDKEQFDQETEALFKENPSLEGKLNKLKQVLGYVRDVIECHKEIKVSFGVFDGIKSLA